MTLEGVYSIQEPHFWTLCNDVYIGTVKLEVAPKAELKYILSHTHNIFTQVILFVFCHSRYYCDKVGGSDRINCSSP